MTIHPDLLTGCLQDAPVNHLLVPYFSVYFLITFLTTKKSVSGFFKWICSAGAMEYFTLLKYYLPKPTFPVCA